MSNEELLKEIEEFAYAYMSKAETAIFAECDIELLNDEENPIGKAFLIGRLRRKVKFNQVVIALSDQLSSPAMAIELKLAEQTYLNDIR